MFVDIKMIEFFNYINCYLNRCLLDALKDSL